MHSQLGALCTLYKEKRTYVNFMISFLYSKKCNSERGEHI